MMNHQVRAEINSLTYLAGGKSVLCKHCLSTNVDVITPPLGPSVIECGACEHRQPIKEAVVIPRRN